MAKPNVVVRNIFDPSEDEGISFVGDPGRTKQAFKDECTISEIVARAEKTGVLPGMIAADPQYGDFSSVPDFQEALALVARAEEQFMSLSAHVRDRFANDPVRFLAFMEDPKNGDEAVKLGLRAAPKGDPALPGGSPEGGIGSASLGAGAPGSGVPGEASGAPGGGK